MNKNWYKVLAVILLHYVIIEGFLVEIPNVANNSILQETIRNLFFHVPMWFSMIFILGMSVFHAIKYLMSGEDYNDIVSVECVNTGILFGIMGVVTGSIWAQFTWGQPWTNDPKLNGAAIGLLMYFAYVVLRKGMKDPQARARVSAVYSIFAFPIFMTMIWILPRINDSLHPGNGGNPGFNSYDLNNSLRVVFYPAVLGWIMLAIWITYLNVRIRKIEQAQNQ
jgi:heme exporter protein C